MKKLFIITFILFNALCMYSQSHKAILNSVFLTESITLRTTYVAGENILFSAAYITTPKFSEIAGNIIAGSIQQYDSTITPFDWSKILYVEIIDNNGKPYLQKKFTIENGKTDGILKVPDNINSGIYFIKAYTRYMQNFSTNKYGYKQILIVNPDAVGTILTSNDSSVTIETTGQYTNNISIELNSSNIKTRSKAEVSLLSKLPVNEFINTVAAVKKGANNAITNPLIFATSKASIDSIKYMPEIFSSYISGTVYNKTDNTFQSNVPVYLSFLGNNAKLLAYNTNEAGEFFFPFPESFRTNEFFISAQADNKKLNIEFNENWCKKPVHINIEDIILSNSELIIANELSVNSQLLKKFDKEKQEKQHFANDSVKKFFYGTPDKIYTTQKYIDLPNIEEFIYEVVKEFSVLHKKDEPYLSMKDKNTFRNYPPLTLVDNVPIMLKTLLAIDMKKVKQLEIINGGYIIGDLKYCSVINVITNNSDFAGITLPENAMFFNYNLPGKSYSHELKTDNPANKGRIPDLRNTLYWNSDIQFINNSSSISFYTSDITGEYQIIVQSVSKITGNVSYSVKEFVVH